MKTKIFIVIFLFLALIGFVMWLKLKQPGFQRAHQNLSPNETEWSVVGNLDQYECLSRFAVQNNKNWDEYKTDDSELVNLSLLQENNFKGKIKSYSREKAQSFPRLINRLMKEQKIRTYMHLGANICLHSIDSLNPPGGAKLTYYIVHYYCTNECLEGTYLLTVELDSNGEFEGRTSNQQTRDQKDNEIL